MNSDKILYARETNKSKIIRNICAVATLLLALYNLYNLFGLGYQNLDLNAMTETLVENNVDGLINDAFMSVLEEDYGITSPLPDFSGIPTVIMCIVCIALCVRANIADGHVVKPLCKTAIFSTGTLLWCVILSDTVVGMMLPLFLNQWLYGYDLQVQSAASMNRYAPNSLLYLLYFAINLSLAIIPASIARKKNRSFIKYFIFGSLAILPTIAVAIMVGDKFEDRKISEKGILFVVWVFVVYRVFVWILTPMENLVTYVCTLFDPEFELPSVTNITTAGIAFYIFEAVLCAVAALLAGFVIVLLLRNVVAAMAMSMNKGKKVMSYSGNNATYVNQLLNAMPIAKKYDAFFRRRDRLASYKELDVDKVLRLAIPVTLIFAVASKEIYINISPFLNIPDAQSIFPLQMYLYAVLGCFILLCLLMKPIAIIRCRRAKKMDAKSDEKGYMAEIRAQLPDFAEIADEELRYKNLRNMSIIMKNVPKNLKPETVSSAAARVQEGIDIGKVLAVLAGTAAVAVAIDKASKE